MDREVELNYRLTGHLEKGECVLATLISMQHGIYAATDRRILCLNNERIGYCLRVHPYGDLERIDCFSTNGSWLVKFTSRRQTLTVRARSGKEARKFVETASELLKPTEEFAG